MEKVLVRAGGTHLQPCLSLGHFRACRSLGEENFHTWGAVIHPSAQGLQPGRGSSTCPFLPPPSCAPPRLLEALGQWDPGGPGELRFGPGITECFVHVVCSLRTTL